MTRNNTMETNIGISSENSKNISDILNRLISDEYILYTKTRNYHWNVVGIQFNDLHKFFESQYDELDVIIDDVAERNRALGSKAKATLSEFIGNARLKEQPDTYPETKTMLRNLLDDHESVIRTLRQDLEICTKLGDAGTSDFLTGLMEKHEKMAWMLRAFLA